MNEEMIRQIEKEMGMEYIPGEDQYAGYYRLNFEPDGTATAEFDGVSLICRAYRVMRPPTRGDTGEIRRVWVHGQDWGWL
jgi:hypothetical protein